MQVEIKEIKMKEPANPQAQSMEEFQNWLNHKKVDLELVMAGNKSDDDDDDDDAGKEEMAIIAAIMSGHLAIDEDMNMIYTLRHPILDDAGSMAVKSLTLKPRMTAAEVQAATKGMTKKDPFKLFVGYISQLSGEVRGIVNKLDSTDFSLLQKIVGYFL